MDSRETEPLLCHSYRPNTNYKNRTDQLSSSATFLAGLLVGGIAVAILSLGSSTTNIVSSSLPPQNQNAANSANVTRKSRFTSAQFLGFNIYTAPGTDLDGCLNSSAAKCYLGHPHMVLDVSRRVDIMGLALDSAYESDAWDRNSSTLKVFIAPEFYFRGPEGAYTIDPTNPTLAPGIAKKLKVLVEDKKWKDWLFVFGTVVLVAKAPPGVCNHPPEYQYLTFNVAPIYGGGPNGRHYVAQKVYISSIDFLEADLFHGNYAEMTDEQIKGAGLHDIEILPGKRFEYEGLDIGIEICLDHQVAGETMEDVIPNSMDIHIITSSGMDIDRGPVQTRRGGPTFLADGLVSGTQMSLNEFGMGTIASVFGDRFDVGYVLSNKPVHRTLPVSEKLLKLYEYLLELPEPFRSYDGDAVVRVSALGPLWREVIAGYFGTLAGEYQKDRYFKSLRVNPIMPEPTIDIYMPVKLV
eukprot:gb/GEZN01006486.1/.p1 GENE.gb/GEZN01006486.1/~~gb/GEZN01006486.1/.p1  ORF type:complete len:473 (+),score=13.94 gb/GEZN01006486.1/:24-1421(+)